MNPVAATAPTTRRRGSRVQDSAPARHTNGGQEPKVVRCGIYTRKSTNEGLDSDFSSIDNQREACESYIKSQREEGWTLIEERFDDGGFSGGTVERPALKRLLTGIEAGEIDCVVVYKIDRLSRSLLDFVRMLEMFEQRQVAFVAVTQQINTTTSAGRLMLNVLMSFAQFEREIGSERTREKVHAARKKGRYIGGHPPLGYDIDKEAHRLIVNPTEARMVTALFDLYLRHRSLLAVVQEVNGRGWRRKSWQTSRGIDRVGAPFEKVYLQRLLTNPLYIGQVTLKGTVYPGQQEAIIGDDVFRQVRDLLTANRREKNPVKRNKHGALLRGLLHCGLCGSGLSHTYTRRGAKLYRYYLCTTVIKQGRSACASPQIPAGDIETQIVAEIRERVQELSSRNELLRSVGIDHREAWKQRLIRFDRIWDVLHLPGRIQLLHQLIDEIIYHHPEGQLEIRFRGEDCTNTNTQPGDADWLAESSVIW